MTSRVLIALGAFAAVAATCFAAAPTIAGSYWSLLAREEAGKPEKDAENPADVEFLKDGKWGVLHYGGRREEGTYVVNGERLEMKTVDGEEYIAGAMSWAPDTGRLVIDSGKWKMRLKLRTAAK